MMSSRKADTSAKKMAKLYVEPAELARKLVKELEGSKVSRSGRAFVRNQYTVFLCREDFGRFRSHMDQLVAKLEGHLEKYVESKGYATTGAMGVEVTMDPELKPGYFGVLAERGMPAAGPRASSAPSAPGEGLWGGPEEDEYPEDGPVSDDYSTGRPSPEYSPDYSAGRSSPDYSASTPPLPGASLSMPPLPGASLVGGSLPGARPSTPPLPSPAQPAAPSYARPLSEGPGPERSAYAVESQPPAAATPPPTQAAAPAPPRLPMAAGAGRADESTGRISPTDASQMDLAKETIVLKANGQEYEFAQGRVIVGRSRDADFRIDHADVSRRHAVIYWSEGSIVVKDLGSTNGTMVNGYPVESTVVRPSDVIRIGNCHITVAPK
jgi:hypothetical protein